MKYKESKVSIQQTEVASTDADGYKTPITNSVQFSTLLFWHKELHRHTPHRSPPKWVQEPQCLVAHLTIQPHLCVCERERDMSGREREREEFINRRINILLIHIYNMWRRCAWTLHYWHSSFFHFSTGCSLQQTSENDQNVFQNNAIEHKTSFQALRLMAKRYWKINEGSYHVILAHTDFIWS